MLKTPTKDNNPAVDLRALARKRTAFEVIELVNRFYIDLDCAFDSDPQLAVSFKAHIEKTDRELLWKLEQRLRLYPETTESGGTRGDTERTASIATGLALTTHLLHMLRFTFNRAQRRIARGKARAEKPRVVA